MKSTATGFFLQRIVRSLQIGGRGCVVLPLGKELSSRAPAEVKLRLALLKALDILEIVAIPSGIFENTSIRTVALIFDKVRELGDCVTRRRIGKGLTIEPRADVANATTDVRFTRICMATDGKTALSEVESIPDTRLNISVEELEEFGWSLSPDDYKTGIDRRARGNVIADGAEYPMVRLGDLCVVETGAYITKNAVVGVVPVYGGGGIAFYTDQSNRESRFVIAKDGVSKQCVRYVSGPFYLNHHGWTLKVKDDSRITDQYLGRYLEFAQCDLYALATGAAQKGISQEKFYSFEISLPPIEVQQLITAELDMQAAGLISLENAVAATERAKKITLDNAIYKWGFLGRTLRQCDDVADGVRPMRLGDLCKMRGGKGDNKQIVVDGAYDFYNASRSNPVAKTNTISFDYPNYIVIVKSGGNSKDLSADVGLGYCWLLNKPIGAASSVMALHTFIPTVDVAYINHYLRLNGTAIRTQCAKFMTGIGNLNQERLSEFEIPLPSIELQRSIVSELDSINAVSKGMSRETSRARVNMARILVSALGQQVIPQAEEKETSANLVVDVEGESQLDDSEAACTPPEDIDEYLLNNMCADVPL